MITRKCMECQEPKPMKEFPLRNGKRETTCSCCRGWTTRKHAIDQMRKAIDTQPGESKCKFAVNGVSFDKYYWSPNGDYSNSAIMDRVQQLVRDYQRGEQIKALTKKYLVTSPTILKLAKALGIARRRGGFQVSRGKFQPDMR